MGRRRNDMPTNAPDTLLAVADAAVVWWVMKRPVQWTLDRHLQHPTINTADNETRLATAVARWCALQQEREDE